MKFKTLTEVSAILIAFTLAQPIVAQSTQYGQGLLLDYYVIQNPDDINEPTGRSMATLVDTSVPHMSYLGPFEIEPALSQFQDKFWGLHWTGHLKSEDAGAYSFNLLLETSLEPSSSTGLDCVSWLKVQDRAVVTHEYKLFQGPSNNAYGDIDLREGIYGIEVWLACNRARYTNIEKTKLEITPNMRGPNDAMLKPIPKNQLLHEL